MDKMTGNTFTVYLNLIDIQSGQICLGFKLAVLFLDYHYMCCNPSNLVMNRCIHHKVDFKSLSWTVWSLRCHNDSLVLVVFFEDIHIRTGSPVSVWGYMEFFLAPKREVGPDSHYALLLRARKGYNGRQFWAWQSAAWLGAAQIGVSISTEF